VLFGSIARGEARAVSDIDLAAIAPNGCDRGVEMADAVHMRLGNDCDVLVFTPTEFVERVRGGEPLVSDILRDGVALVGLSRESPSNAIARGRF
jgi:predicted nucleotidyltransferase